ncbi:NS4 protein [Chenuda virus]|uniref:NS4 protein n=1 Tax=Chenuda virus TaxID=40065 RepID=A0A0H4M5E4_9REOV|nr:NS4 protein [Chenuda virus]AKP24094.1 NS4 protein [Chenuda virus]
MVGIKTLLRLLRRNPRGARNLVSRLEDPAAHVMYQIYQGIDHRTKEGREARWEVSQMVLRVMFNLPQIIMETGVMFPMLRLPEDEDVLMTLAIIRRRRLMETEAAVRLTMAQKTSRCRITWLPNDLLRFCVNAERKMWKFLNLGPLFRLTVHSFGLAPRRLSPSERNRLKALRRKTRRQIYAA